MERSYGVGARCMNFYNEKKKKKSDPQVCFLSPGD